MENKFEFEFRENKPAESAIQRELVGKIGAVIGTGKHAQAAIVWTTIKWSFIGGVFLTVLDFIKSYNDTKFPMDDIKTIWAIFIPLITLSLGYIFGKGKE